MKSEKGKEDLLTEYLVRDVLRTIVELLETLSTELFAAFLLVLILEQINCYKIDPME